MTFKSLALLTAAALALAACGDKDAQQAGGNAAAPAQIAAPQGQDWTQVVSRTEEGGFRMGNPDAPVKLVEYASFTCPHCREFTEMGVPTLRDTYVKSGQVSWEFRSFLLSPLDVPVSLAAACQGPGAYFTLVDQVYAAQPEWVGKFQALPASQLQALQSLPEDRQFVELAKLGGLDQFFRVRGVPGAKLEQCLSDKAATEALAKSRETATERDKVTGTPSFLINGTNTGVFSWPELEPKLKEALS